MTVTEVDLGPAHACYDHVNADLYLTPGLTGREQDHVARDVLTQAGIPQPTAGGVRCHCGLMLDMPGRSEAA